MSGFQPMQLCFPPPKFKAAPLPNSLEFSQSSRNPPTALSNPKPHVSNTITPPLTIYDLQPAIRQLSTFECDLQAVICNLSPVLADNSPPPAHNRENRTKSVAQGETAMRQVKPILSIDVLSQACPAPAKNQLSSPKNRQIINSIFSRLHNS